MPTPTQESARSSVPQVSNRVHTGKAASRYRRYDRAEIFRLIDSGLSQSAVGRQLGYDQGYISRLLKARRQQAVNNGDADDPQTSLQRLDVVGEVDSAEPVQSSAEPVQSSAEPVQSSADVLSDHETRLQVVESFIATLQAQAAQQITVQSSADGAYALHSAETVQTWDDPDDAKPVRWNLWVPSGLKRHIEAHAKAAGIAPSQLVQRLLMAALGGRAHG